jgi:hypothetical protein
LNSERRDDPRARIELAQQGEVFRALGERLEAGRLYVGDELGLASSNDRGKPWRRIPGERILAIQGAQELDFRGIDVGCSPMSRLSVERWSSDEARSCPASARN